MSPQERNLVSHAEAAKALRKAGYSHEQIQEKLGDLPDPIDTERYGNEIVERGISMWQLMDLMGGSP
jgi:hypothetical protein